MVIEKIALEKRASYCFCICEVPNFLGFILFPYLIMLIKGKKELLVYLNSNTVIPNEWNYWETLISVIPFAIKMQPWKLIPRLNKVISTWLLFISQISKNYMQNFFLCKPIPSSNSFSVVQIPSQHFFKDQIE